VRPRCRPHVAEAIAEGTEGGSMAFRSRPPAALETTMSERRQSAKISHFWGTETMSNHVDTVYYLTK
jgi:hypothetical protein